MGATFHASNAAESDSAIDVVQLSNTIMDIVQQAVNFQQLKKGANEGAPSNLQGTRSSLLDAGPHCNALLAHIACSGQA